jgi:hypothetical protein
MLTGAFAFQDLSHATFVIMRMFGSIPDVSTMPEHTSRVNSTNQNKENSFCKPMSAGRGLSYTFEGPRAVSNGWTRIKMC